MPTNKTISVIVSAWKASEFIEESIFSILDQKLPTDYSLQIILGVDGCPETLKSVNSLNIPNLKIVNFPQNIGVYKAFNSLFEYVEGEFFMWFGADDIMGNNMIYNMSSCLINNEKSSVAGTQLVIINDKADKVLPHFNKYYLAEGIRMWKTNVWTKKIGSFQEWVCAADYEANQRALHSHKINCEYDGDSYYCYRKHPNALTVKKNTKPGSNIRKNYLSIIKDNNKKYKNGYICPPLENRVYDNFDVTCIGESNTLKDEIYNRINKTRNMCEQWRKKYVKNS